MTHCKQSLALLIVLLCTLANAGLGQTSSEEQILRLKNGVILVRLSTKEATINALNERGLTNKAKEVERYTKLNNLAWIQAFRGEFTFCPVYFFYSNESKKIRTNELDQVEFLDDALNPTNYKPEKGVDYLIGDITNIDPEYSNATFEALIIKDAGFNQLKRPFPYYVRTFNTIFFLKRKPNKVVRKMNIKLKEFYQQCSK
ncbi:MAG: hypothetical protein AB8B53_08290 [Flavobacteriales bacterium]